MTTNKLNSICMMFVVGIIYLNVRLIIKFDILDFTYLLFIIICLIKYIIIKQVKE